MFPRIPLIVSLALVLAQFDGSLKLAHAQGEPAHYVNDRVQGDLAATPYRQELTAKIEKIRVDSWYQTVDEVVSQVPALSRNSFGPPIRVSHHLRSIGRYGLGHATAYRYFPAATSQIIRMIVILSARLRCHCEFPLYTSLLKEFMEAEIDLELYESAWQKLLVMSASRPELYLDYYGYLWDAIDDDGRPKVRSTAGKHEWTFFLRFNRVENEYFAPTEPAHIAFVRGWLRFPQRKSR